jgi:hypothetical protein
MEQMNDRSGKSEDDPTKTSSRVQSITTAASKIELIEDALLRNIGGGSCYLVTCYHQTCYHQTCYHQTCYDPTCLGPFCYLGNS